MLVFFFGQKRWCTNCSECVLIIDIVLVFKALTLRTVHGRRIFHTWRNTEALVADGKVDVNALISHRFPMSKFEDAFKVLFSGKGCKIVLYPSEWKDNHIAIKKCINRCVNRCVNFWKMNKTC